MEGVITGFAITRWYKWLSIDWKIDISSRIMVVYDLNNIIIFNSHTDGVGYIKGRHLKAIFSLNSVLWDIICNSMYRSRCERSRMNFKKA